MVMKLQTGVGRNGWRPRSGRIESEFVERKPAFFTLPKQFPLVFIRRKEQAGRPVSDPHIGIQFAQPGHLAFELPFDPSQWLQ
jgi:hypothetical protein